MGTGIALADVLPRHEPESLPLTRSAGTLSPIGREGRGEGVRLTGSSLRIAAIQA